MQGADTETRRKSVVGIFSAAELKILNWNQKRKETGHRELVTYKMHFEEGNDPREVIVDYAIKEKASYIVMGSRGLSGLQRVMLGSVSDYLVRHAPCPVVIIRQKD